MQRQVSTVHKCGRLTSHEPVHAGDWRLTRSTRVGLGRVFLLRRAGLSGGATPAAGMAWDRQLASRLLNTFASRRYWACSNLSRILALRLSLFLSTACFGSSFAAPSPSTQPIIF